MFECQECGRKFKTVAAAERATNNGCPKCGGTDIDLPKTEEQRQREYLDRHTSLVYRSLPIR